MTAATTAGSARSSTLRADLALAGAAMMFGSTFVVVQDAAGEVGTVPFLAARFLVGAVVLAPWAWRWRSCGPAAPTPEPAPRLGFMALGAGTALAAGYLFQTFGLEDTTTSVSAFLTYLLVIFVPLISTVLLRQPPRPATAAGVVVAVAGLLALTLGGQGDAVGFGRGEALSVLCAVAFAAHILVLANAAPHIPVTTFNAAQFAVVGLALVGPGFLAGGYRFPLAVWAAVLYTGIVVNVVAFSLQLWGQRRVSATRTALVLMFEPVFAAIVGYAVGERLGALGVIGGVLILAGILVSELGAERSE